MWNYINVIVGLLIGAAGVGLPLYLHYKQRIRRRFQLNWIYDRCVNELLVKIRKQQYDPSGKKLYDFDCIVGIDGGGMIIASILQLHLGKPVLYLPAMRGAPQRFPRSFCKDLPSLEDKRVLLVDDASDTGDTLREAKDTLLNVLGAQLVKIAVISKRQSPVPGRSPIDIDFFVASGEHAGDYRDIELPWAIKT